MIDATLFCQIIDSEPSVKYLRQENEQGFIFMVYEGSRGMVIIDFDDENFTDNSGKGYLRKLGLEHLIPAIYPNEPEIQETAEPLISEKSEENECSICNGVGSLQKGEELIPCTECNGTGTLIAIN